MSEAKRLTDYLPFRQVVVSRARDERLSIAARSKQLRRFATHDTA